MTGTAVVRSANGEQINPATGEVLNAIQPFSARDYLVSVTSDAALAHQKELAAAYDKACSALIGPNDVQQDGGRTFKKKSAWRKLGRHFNISTFVGEIQKEDIGGVFVATVTVRASAPWGQSAEAVGSCGTDEATGRRVITIADAIATAETRATNRAVSNLIAMGEVSAEEMSGKSEPRKASTPAPTNTADAAKFPLPFGKSKGTPLWELKRDDLQGAYDWAVSKGKFKEFQEAAKLVLSGGSKPAPAPEFEDFPGALEDADDNLPF